MMRSPRSFERRLVLLVLAVGNCFAAIAQAQEAQSTFQPYDIKHVSPADAAARLDEMLSGTPGVDVIADPRGGRILVQGPPQAQRLARDLIATLDRPAQAPVQEEALLKAYSVPADSLAEVSAKLRLDFGKTPGLRVATDNRTGQLLVVAPPTVHRDIEAMLQRNVPRPAVAATSVPQAGERTARAAPVQAATVASAETPTTAAKPGQQSHELRHLTSSEFEKSLDALSQYVTQAVESADGAVATYTLKSSQGAVTLSVNRRAGQIFVEGDGGLVHAWMQVATALDRPKADAKDRTQVIPVQKAQPASMRKLASALRQDRRDGAGRAPAEEGFATAMLQQRRQNDDRNARPNDPLAEDDEEDPDAAPADPAAAQPAPAAAQPAQSAPAAGAGADPADVEGAMIGTVQIEFLEGLDVVVIRGHQRDVERVTQMIADIERLSGETQPAIEIYPLKHVDSVALATLIQQLYEQVLSLRQTRVSVTALGKPSALLLIGREDGVKIISDLIERLDQPVDPQSQFQVFFLKHTAASTVQTTITEFFANRTVLGAKVVVTSDVRSNSLIVQAAPRDMAEVSKLIERIDTPTSEAVNELRVFPLQNSLADDLAPVLQQAVNGQAGAGGLGQRLPGAVATPIGQAAGQLGGAQAGQQVKSTMLRFMTIDAQGQRQLNSGILTDVKITADPRANALLVSAPADSMELLSALIRQLDQMPTAEAQIKVFTIVNGDATTLVQTLETLFGQANQGQAGGGGGGLQGLLQANLQSGSADSSLVPLRFSVDQRTNSIVASGGVGDLNVVEAILLRLDDSDVRQRQSVVYRLKNAPALDVATAINEFLRSERQVQAEQTSPFQQIEREVVVVPEAVSNSLIVSATPRYFNEIRRIVEQLDARPPMVMIQVLIAEVSLNNVDEFGVELGLQDSILFDRSLLGDLVTTTTTTSVGNPAVTTQQQNVVAATNTPGFNFNNQPLGNSGSSQALANSNRVGGQGLSNFAVGRINNELGFGGLVLSASSESVSVLLRALNECRRLDILSRPQITTLDNQPAYIQVGQRVPRITGSEVGVTGTVNTVTLENVGLILGVTPRISPDGLVVMEIDAEKSELGPEAEGIPISISVNGDVIRSPRIDTTTAQTTVSALSGQTIVLGGLITKSKSGVHRRVPILSDIPILGNLFRYDRVDNRRTELLIIMTPRVIRDEADADIIKQVESSRMSWCLSDVVKLHGPSGLRSRSDEWTDAELPTIFPDLDPTGGELMMDPDGAVILPEGAVMMSPDGVPIESVPAPAAEKKKRKLWPLGKAKEEPLPVPAQGGPVLPDQSRLQRQPNPLAVEGQAMKSVVKPPAAGAKQAVAPVPEPKSPTAFQTPQGSALQRPMPQQPQTAQLLPLASQPQARPLPPPSTAVQQFGMQPQVVPGQPVQTVVYEAQPGLLPSTQPAVPNRLPPPNINVGQ